jgi:uncharacterized membrane protein (UPF0127 family)
MVTLLVALALAFPRGTAIIQTSHANVRVHVEIAQTQRARTTGLMRRRTLAPDAGMLFVFPRNTRGSFWMKDTLLPLSIAFYSASGRILRILDMTPCRTAPCRLYNPRIAYRGALEVNRGAFRRWNVTAGDRITLARRP